MVHAVDNNCINKFVTEFRPDVVVIEALWVVPEKFDELISLHPKVKWTVRIHSEIPFLAYEGTAMDWIHGYIERGVQVSVNSRRTQRDIHYGTGVKPAYTPNYYKPEHTFQHIENTEEML